MSEGRFSDRSMAIVSIILAVIILAAFIWLWFGYQRPSPEIYRSSADLQPVDVESLSTRGKTLIEGLKNNGGIPIPEPIGKMGRADPFANVE